MARGDTLYSDLIIDSERTGRLYTAVLSCFIERRRYVESLVIVAGVIIVVVCIVCFYLFLPSSCLFVVVPPSCVSLVVSFLRFVVFTAHGSSCIYLYSQATATVVEYLS